MLNLKYKKAYTLIIILIVFLIGFNVNVAEAKKKKNCSGSGDISCIPESGGPYFVNGGCANFNYNGRHYGPWEACQVLGGSHCGGGGGGGGAPAETYVDPCEGRYGECETECNARCCPRNGSCSAINGKVISKNPGAQACSAAPGGPPRPTLNSDKYNWTCAGSCGGASQSCSAYVLPQVGKCGDSFVSGSNSLVNTLPADSIICKRGNPINKNEGADKFTWTCQGTGGAASSNVCTAMKVGEGQTATIFSTSTPVTSLTVTGRITPNIVNKGQYCTLSDLEYTTNAGANNQLIACSVYRGPNVYPDKSTATLNYQVEPGYDYEFRCADFNSPYMSNKTKPLKCVLNPSVIER